MKKLSEEERESCEGLLTFDECKITIQNFEKNKSPGNDGLTAEFYQFFWYLFGNLIVDSFNKSFEEGMLAASETNSDKPNSKKGQG